MCSPHGARADVDDELGASLTQRALTSVYWDGRDPASVCDSPSVSCSAPGYVWALDPRVQQPSRMRMSLPQVCAYNAAVQCDTLLVLPREHSAILDRDFETRRASFGPAGARPDAAGDVEVHGRLRTEWLAAGGHHLHVMRAPECAARLVAFVRGSTAASL